MINPSNKDLIPLSKAARLLPKFNGKHPNPSTIWRWCTTGLHGAKLQYARVGNRMCTTEEALHQFLYREDKSPPENLDLPFTTEPEDSPVQDTTGRLEAVSERLKNKGV